MISFIELLCLSNLWFLNSVGLTSTFLHIGHSNNFMLSSILNSSLIQVVFFMWLLKERIVWFLVCFSSYSVYFVVAEREAKWSNAKESKCKFNHLLHLLFFQCRTHPVGSSFFYIISEFIHQFNSHVCSPHLMITILMSNII